MSGRATLSNRIKDEDFKDKGPDPSVARTADFDASNVPPIPIDTMKTEAPTTPLTDAISKLKALSLPKPFQFPELSSPNDPAAIQSYAIEVTDAIRELYINMDVFAVVVQKLAISLEEELAKDTDLTHNQPAFNTFQARTTIEALDNGNTEKFTIPDNVSDDIESIFWYKAKEERKLKENHGFPAIEVTPNDHEAAKQICLRHAGSTVSSGSQIQFELAYANAFLKHASFAKARKKADFVMSENVAKPEDKQPDLNDPGPLGTDNS